jgi:hypothetical protein
MGLLQALYLFLRAFVISRTTLVGLKLEKVPYAATC